ncbi:transposon-transfer assisting family protein [Zongyangia sp. HA2173]|uniref:transposon-transfer assisting family protein n=1 Tax=Zongyangia sp. HA2173 TaxID=3133035 RepID=UPI0031653401
MTKGLRLYHKGDRRRMAADVRADIPDMDGEMRALARQTSAKQDAMSDIDFEAQRFQFTDE